MEATSGQRVPVFSRLKAYEFHVLGSNSCVIRCRNDKNVRKLRISRICLSLLALEALPDTRTIHLAYHGTTHHHSSKCRMVRCLMVILPTAMASNSIALPQIETKINPRNWCYGEIGFGQALAQAARQLIIFLHRPMTQWEKIKKLPHSASSFQAFTQASDGPIFKFSLKLSKTPKST